MASGTIKAVAGMYNGAFEHLTFSFSTSDWTSSNGVYIATKTSTHITDTSQDFVEFDSSARSYLLKDISWVKVSGGGGLIFSTASKPVGTISGEIYVIKT